MLDRRKARRERAGADSSGAQRGRVQLGDAKVDEDVATFGRALDIAWLDVAMHDGAVVAGLWVALVMHVGDGLHDLLDTGQRLAHRQRAVRTHHLVQVLTWHVFHHQVLATARLQEVVDHLRQVGMAQVRQQHRLAAKLALRLLVVVDILLDRHQPPGQIQVLGQVDGAHPALAEQSADAITMLVKMTAWFQTHSFIP